MYGIYLIIILCITLQNICANKNKNNLNYLDRLNNPLRKIINLQYFMSEKADTNFLCFPWEYTHS